MLGLISKRKLKKYISGIKTGNRAKNLGQNYNLPNEKQKIRNIYAQGYEDGTDNFFNAVCSHFNIKGGRKND